MAGPCAEDNRLSRVDDAVLLGALIDNCRNHQVAESTRKKHLICYQLVLFEVLMWETFVEDIVDEGQEFILTHVTDPTVFGLRRFVARLFCWHCLSSPASVAELGSLGDRNAMSHPNTNHRFLGSLLAATFGWATTLSVLVAHDLYSRGLQSSIDGFVRGALFLAVIFGGAWLIVLLPIYLLVPIHWIFWRWPFATLCGTGIVWLLLWVVFHDGFTSTQYPMSYLIPGAVTGGTTALFSSLTARFFVGTNLNRDSNA